MAQSNEIKIIVGGDAAAFKKAATDVVASAELIESSLQGAASASQTAATAVKSSFDAMAASKAAIDKLNASIDAAANAALQAGPKFDSLGGRLPLQDFNEFKRQIDVFKRDISSGFKFNFPPKPIPAELPVLLEKTNKASKSAAGALTGLNRVVQDAPFGFAAIGNNLTELPGLFTTFSNAAKESGQSVKSLFLSTLLGPAGIGTALSLVTSALTFATVGFGAWTRGFKGADDAIDKTKKEIDDFIKSLKSVDDTIREATASQEGDIARVQALAAAVSDSNKPYKERQRALEELKEVNKAYFGDLKLEDAATSKLANTVREYTDALINSAIQKEFVNDIAAIAKEVAKQDGVIANARLKVAQAQREVNKAQQQTKESFTEEQISANAASGAAAIDKLKDAQEDLGKENEKVTQLLVQEALVRSQLNKAVEEGLKFKDIDAKASKKEEDFLKKRLEALEKIQAATKDATTRVGLQEQIFELQTKITLRDAGKNSLSKAEVDQAIQGFQKELQKEFDNQAIELEAMPKVRFSQTTKLDQKDIINKVFTSKQTLELTIGGVRVNTESVDITDLQDKVAKATGLDKKIKIPTQFEIDLNFFGKKFADAALIARNQMEAVIGAIANGVQSAVTEGAAVIGEAFAGLISGEGVGSALAKAAQGLLAIIGGILQDVGKQIIVTSGLVAALKAALKGLFGPGGEAIGLAVGAALIATGALLKSIKFDVPKLADGGIATRATLGIFGEAGREAIIPLNKLPEIVGKLSTDNQQAIVINGNMRVDGTDLSLMLERVSGRRSRLG